MIPLAHWLSAREAGSGVHSSVPLSGDVIEAVEAQEAAAAARLEEAYARGRQDAYTETEAERLRLISDHAESLQRLEADLNAKWANISASQFAEELSAALQELRRQLDEAISTILEPFLSEAVAERAAARLMDLISEEAARTAHPILEIRAPAALHERLSERLSEQGVSALLTPSATIEVVARDGSVRFASMAARWLALIRSDEHE